MSPKAATIKLMDVNEFIEKFRNVFEPKPKPVVIPKSDQPPRFPAVTVPRPIEVQQPRRIDPRDAGVRIVDPRKDAGIRTIEEPAENDAIKIQHVLPQVILEKIRPTVQVSSEPSTPLGRILIILANHEGRDDRWTGAKIKTSIREHAWPDDEVDEAIAELTRWEILRRQSNNYLRFYRDRVQVVDRPYGVAVS